MKTLVGVLERVADRVDSVAPGTWGCTLHNGAPFDCSVRVDGDWLVLTARSAELDAVPDAWTVVQLNRRYDTVGGFAIERSGALVLRAECLLSPTTPADFSDMEDRVGAAFAGFARALDGVSESAAESESESERHPAFDAVELERRLTASGWAPESRVGSAESAEDAASARTLTVRLPAVRQTVRARLEPARDGTIRVAADLEPVSVTSPVCREALAHHLLAAASGLRMVRGAVACEPERGGRVVPQFSTHAAASATPRELGHAIAALSVACDRHGPESIALVVDPRIAEHYLLARGSKYFQTSSNRTSSNRNELEPERARTGLNPNPDRTQTRSEPIKEDPA